MKRRATVYPLDVTKPGVVEVRLVRPPTPEIARLHAETLNRLRDQVLARRSA